MMAGSRVSAGEVEGWPLFVHVETRRRPRWHWATVLLVSVCVVCFVGLAMIPRPQRLAWVVLGGTGRANFFYGH
jgi:hypothetical protein